MAKAKFQARRKNKNTLAPNLLVFLQGHPEALEILDKHGINFCAGCYLTLSSPIDRAAAYHAVPNIPGFLKDLKRFAK
ncbi:MAG: hypothetical protein HY399_07275 [Elusimicrobia bacterium]|nr:hypothetical protein [Elusimicrobiota bacterium]